MVAEYMCPLWPRVVWWWRGVSRLCSNYVLVFYSNHRTSVVMVIRYKCPHCNQIQCVSVNGIYFQLSLVYWPVHTSASNGIGYGFCLQIWVVQKLIESRLKLDWATLLVPKGGLNGICLGQRSVGDGQDFHCYDTIIDTCWCASEHKSWCC